MNDSPNHGLVARVRGVIPLALGLVSILAVYSRVLDAPFLWDDGPLLQSPVVQRLHWPWQYLSVPFYALDERAGLFFRPAVTFSLALDRAVHGENASGFHLTNLILHVLCVFLVYVLARRHGAAQPAAAFAATSFGLLPRLTESVAWVAGRTDVLCTLFVLLAWLAYERGSFGRILLATAFAFLALLSKESGIAVVVAIAAVELWPWPSKPALKRLAPLFALTALYLLLRAEALRKSAPDFALTPIERVLTILEAVGRYVFMTLDPWQPRTQIGLIKDPAYGFVLLGVTGLAAACVFLWKTRKKWTRERFFAGVLVLLPLLLVIHVIPLPWLVVAADRLIYTPFAALAVAIAPALGAVFPSRRLVTVGAIALAASFAAATFTTTAFYLDPAAFWVRAVETTPPSNFLPTRNLAAEFARQGLYEDALALARSVEHRADPTGVQHYPNFVRASLLVNLGRYAEAEALVDRTHAGGTAEMDMQRAHLLANFRRVREARTIARDVLERHPGLGSATWLLRHVEQYEQDRKKLADPALSALDRAVLTARAEIRVGRRLEGTLAWLALVSDPKTPKAVVDEGMPVLIWFASFEHLRQAARLYRARPDPTPAVLVMLEQRELSARQLIDAHPRIERALGLRFQR